MAKKDRQKRSARQARAQERAAREAAQEQAAASSEGKGIKKSDAAKKSPKKAEKAAKKPGRVRTYFRGVKSELHRVTWPSKKELKDYSVATVAMLIVFGVVVWLVDTGFIGLLVGFTSLGTGLRG